MGIHDFKEKFCSDCSCEKLKVRLYGEEGEISYKCINCHLMYLQREIQEIHSFLLNNDATPYMSRIARETEKGNKCLNTKK